MLWYAYVLILSAYLEFRIEAFCVTTNIYFKHKAEQSERIAGWADYTYYKLKQVFIRILYEAGFINDQNKREIVKPIMPEEIINHIKKEKGDQYLSAMLAI